MKKTNIKVILIVVCAVLLVAGGISAINGAGKDVGNQEAKNSAVSQTKDTVPVSVKTQAVAV